MQPLLSLVPAESDSVRSSPWPLAAWMLAAAGLTTLLLAPLPFGQLLELVSLRSWYLQGRPWHLLGYGTLTTLTLLRAPAALRWRWAVCGLALHATLTELTQPWIPPRSFEWADLACNLTGIAAGCGVARLLTGSRRRAVSAH